MYCPYEEIEHLCTVLRLFWCMVHFDMLLEIPAKFCFRARNSCKLIPVAICGSTETLLVLVWREDDRKKKPLLTILLSCKHSGIKTSLSLLSHQQEVRPCSDRLPPVLVRRNQFVNIEDWLLFATAEFSIKYLQNLIKMWANHCYWLWELDRYKISC